MSGLEAVFEADRIITAISFATDGIEVQFQDKRRQSPKDAEITTRAIEIDEADEILVTQFLQLQDILNDIIDESYARSQEFQESLDVDG